MTLFKDQAEFIHVFDSFFKELLVHPLIGPKLLRAKMVVQFQFTDPDAVVTFDMKQVEGDPLKANLIHWGQTQLKPDVTFRQTADFSTRFWQGKENVIAAMAKRQVTASGSIPKALALIPVIRPSFRIFPQVLQKLGKDHLIAH